METINEIKKKNRDKKDLARGIDYLLARALIEKGNLAFLSLGRPEEVGCYCSVNTLLREAIEELSGKFDGQNLSFFDLLSCPASKAVIKALAAPGILA